MRLSIGNLLDWMKRKFFSIEAAIEDDQPALCGVRYLQDYSADIDVSDMVFIGSAEDFMYPALPATVICCKNNIIYIHNESQEAVLNECIRAFEFYNRWETGLLEAVIRDASLQEFLELGHQVFQSPMFISSANGQTLAISSQYPASINPIWKERLENGNLSFEFINGYHESAYFSEMYGSDYPRLDKSPIWGKKILFSNLKIHNERVGSVIIYEHERSFYPSDVHILKTYAHIVEQALALHRNRYFALSDIEDIVLRILHDNVVDWNKVNMMLHSNEWIAKGDFQVICSCAPSGIDSVVIGRLRDVLKRTFPDACVVFYDNFLVTVINNSSLSDMREYPITQDAGEADGFRSSGYARRIINVLLDTSHNKLVSGISYSFQSLTALKAFYQQACNAVRKALMLNKEIVCFEEIFYDELTALANATPYLYSMIHPDVLRLFESDRNSGTDYIRTLHAYLVCDRNSREAAAMIYVHRNTLLYRMDKIKEMISMDLSDNLSKNILLISVSLLHVL